MADSKAYFAKTNYRNQFRTFGIHHPDRRLHTYVIGKTGTGKSTLLRNLIISDIRNGHGVGIIDPHGDLVESIRDFIPSHRSRDVVYVNPDDREHPVGFNVLESVDPENRALVASHVISIFKNIWHDSWGPRMEWILYNAVAALLDYQNATLLGIAPLLTSTSYQERVLPHIQDPIVRGFWATEYPGYSEEFRRTAIVPIQDKVGQFLTSAPIRNILGQVKSTIDMSSVMDQRRILLVNLSKGNLGEDKTALLGSLFVTKMFLAALQRVNQPEEMRQDFYLYVDECQNLSTPIFASILSEARKYRLNLILANQYLYQLAREIKEAILGNVGTLISFRLGAEDAEALAREFRPEFRAGDLEGLGQYDIYLRLAVNGVTSRPFSATTLPPTTAQPTEQNWDNILKTCRRYYSAPRAVVEEKINGWMANIGKLEDARRTNDGTIRNALRGRKRPGR
jgi:hypothetical protein